ncbi:MAG TPA: EF-P beta-lysylation protein EpmB [Rudaea sp.]|jgi:EF-P beta-lysylation protein EpmB|nr:EF-P beta-lysylation protein EpmB [Rudaea sp.]
MIPATPLRAQPPARWQQLWREAITDARELLDAVGLADRADELLPDRDTGFAVRVPRGFVARMRYGDADDPLLRQVLAVREELLDVPGFCDDAVGDSDARVVRGVLHKYDGRALLIATGTCAVNCRYCFRRHFDYAEDTAAANRWQASIEHIRNDASIDEVILSGGDPLSLSTPKLAELTDALAGVAHVRRLRIHTRLPVVLPERIDTEFIAWMSRLSWPIAIVLHANHANEIDSSVAESAQRLRAAGATLLNQSVLLRGVNDSVNALADLSVKLFDAGIVPYYLHQLDRVSGTAHFEVDDARAHTLMEGLRGRLSGYLVPRLVREIAGQDSKTPL